MPTVTPGSARPPARPEVPVERVGTRVWTVPTDRPESDGTLEWDSTTVVLVEIRAGGHTGTGWTYGHRAVAEIVEGKLAPLVTGADALRPGASRAAMTAACRNLGRPGAGAMAVSAVDIALWDLKARLLGIPLVTALDAVHDATPVYGSGGFTSYSEREIAEQVEGWTAQGIPRVKIKIGRDPDADPARLRAARAAAGETTELYTDANGAYHRKQALDWADRLRREYGVSWLEEPVGSDDLEGLRLLRDRGPGGLDIAAGEYGFDLTYFHHMLDAGAVDCLQADVTRCGGISGFLRAAALCDARTIDLSAHCAPQISAHVCTAVWHLRHLEYFHDHVRIEEMLFDGVLTPEEGGVLRPDRTRPGHGLTLVPERAERYRVA
ncbi:mandelate racemase [Streptomyces sp. WAC 00631]|uniref:enolase C-terminal domain-like protein n=1 Tax=unclassified Streptomyces TaxID=2593676 RepID=UPI000F7B4685|nr:MULTISPECIES: enolase C-terminal domain-like protein [unclassified Streptomyces]MCC5033668.1 mandelate racemase [Streptomyces sp. WAC 00631]MCC9742940.1 mandelate racemase [Streptomyces sp. MNU89]